MSLRFDRQRDAPSRRSLMSGMSLRLVSMVAALALVMVMMQAAKSPETERKLQLLFGENPPTPVGGASQADLTPEFSIDYPPGVRKELLDQVEDNTPFRDGEREAWFHLLQLVKSTEAETLQASSLGSVVYAQFLNQPEFYRGRVVSLQGTARRVEIVKAAENDLGIRELYRVILQPFGETMPVTLFCLELPSDSSKESLENAPIRMSGFFFKNHVYDHASGVDLSPVVLSKSFETLMRPSAPAAPENTMPFWQVVAAATVVAAVIVMLVVHRSTVRPRGEVRRVAEEADIQSLESLEADAT